MTTTNFTMTTGLTLIDNFIVCIQARYETESKSILVFLDNNYNVLSAKTGELWFEPLPMPENMKFTLSFDEVLGCAKLWAEYEKDIVNNTHPDERDYDSLWELNDIINFNDDGDLIASYEHRMEQEAIMEEKYLREQIIHEEWLKYPRIAKPVSRELPINYDPRNGAVCIACKRPLGISFVTLSFDNEGYCDEVRYDKAPAGVPIYRGWWEEGYGYTGGHTSQSGYATYNVEPHEEASYFYDTSYEGNSSGCYPSMLSF